MTGLARYLADPAFTATTFVVIDFEGCTPAGFAAEPIEVGAIIGRPTASGLEIVV